MDTKYESKYQQIALMLIMAKWSRKKFPPSNSAYSKLEDAKVADDDHNGLSRTIALFLE